MNYLRIYTMTYDTEFAPNPHHGVLTLATCMERIRANAQPGDWIAGWAGVTVVDKDNNTVKRGEGQKLIYLAKVDEVIPYAEYWNRFPEKRPKMVDENGNVVSSNCKGKKQKNCKGEVAVPQGHFDSGDNIYEPIFENGELVGFLQHPNGGGHGADLKDNDLKGKNALLCSEFYYFGINNALSVPSDVFPFKVPRYKKVPLNDVEGFLSFVEGKANHKIGIVG